MRKKTVKTRRGGGWGKDKYEGLDENRIRNIKNIKEFLHKVSGDGGNINQYKISKSIPSHQEWESDGGEYYGREEGNFVTIPHQSGYINTFREQALMLVDYAPYEYRQVNYNSECLYNIFKNCSANCLEYRDALQTIYTRINDPNWMFSYMWPSSQETEQKDKPDRLEEYRQNLYNVFQKVDERINDPEKKLNKDVVVEEGDIQYEIPLKGGKRRRSKKRKSKKRRSIKRRTKKIRR